MLKQANLSFSVTAQANGNETNAIQFSTQDKKTAKLIFTIKEGKAPLNLTDIDGEITLVMQDKSRFVGKAEVTKPLDGVLEYTLTQEQIRHAGRAQGEIILKADDGSSVGGFRFNFTIKKALVDEDLGPVKEFYIEDLETVRQGVKKKADAATLDIENLKTEIESLAENLEEEYQNKAYTVDEKLADVQATVNDLRENGTGIDAQARQEVEYVVQHGIPCKALGMIPNSPSEANDNYTKLTNAIKSGKAVAVDDVYYIASNTITEIPGLILTGITTNAEFRFTSVAYLWKPSNSKVTDMIYINRMKFTAEHQTYNTGDAPRLFSTAKTDKWLIKQFKITNCVFDGGFGVFRADAQYLNPLVESFGFEQIDIKDNIFLNSSWNDSTFRFSNLPHEMISFENNKIYNFDGPYFACAIENTHPYAIEMASSMKKMIFKNNHFINDDDFWSSGKTAYTCALLYEGVYAEYSYNHIEGLKTNAAASVLYDAYFGTTTLVSKENMCKNIMHTNPGLSTEVSIFKAKGSSEGKDLYRLYENNKYIFNEEWGRNVAEKKGTNINKVSHSVHDVQTPIKEYIVRNCYIDVYYLAFRQINALIDKLVIEDNHFHAKYMGDSFVYYYSNESYNNGAIVRNNKVISDEKPTFGPYGSSTIPTFSVAYLLPQTTSLHSIKNLDISNNYFKVFNIDDVVRSSGSINNFYVDNMVFSNNTIDSPDTSTTSNKTMYLLSQAKYSIKHLEMDNNKYIFDYSVSPYRPNYLIRLPIMKPNIKYQYKGTVSDFSFLYGLVGDIRLDGTYHIFTKIKIWSDLKFEEFLFRLKYFPDNESGRNALEFLDSTGAVKKALLVKTNDTTFTDNHDVNIKTENIYGTSNHQFKLYNSNTHGYPHIRAIFSNVAPNNTKIWNIEVDVTTVKG